MRHATRVVVTVLATLTASCTPAQTRLYCQLKPDVCEAVSAAQRRHAPTTTVPTTTVPVTVPAAIPAPVVVSMPAPAAPQPTATPPRVAARAVYTYGHSYLSFPDHTPWPDLVASALGLPVENRGARGDMMQGTINIVRSARPLPSTGDIVVIEVGLNDSRFYGTDASKIPAFRARLREAYDTLSSQGARVLIATDAPLLDWSNPDPDWSHGSDAALALYRQAVIDEIGSAIDLGRYWDRTTMIGPDRIHPNTAGAEALAHAIEDGLGA